MNKFVASLQLPKCQGLTSNYPERRLCHPDRLLTTLLGRANRGEPNENYPTVGGIAELSHLL